MVQFVKSFAGVKPWTVQYHKKIEKIGKAKQTSDAVKNQCN